MLCYEGALKILYEYGGHEAWTRHCVAVSRVARQVGRILAKKHDLDERLLTVGALLHDIGRCKTQDPISHGVEGYRLLTVLGHHREAFICASHILWGMPRHEAVLYGLPDRDFMPQSLEERLVPLIDGVVEFDRATTMKERCASISRRYRRNPVFLERFNIAAAAAQCHMQALEDDHGISIEKTAFEVLR